MTTETPPTLPEPASPAPVQKADLSPRPAVRRTTAAQIGGLFLTGLAVLLFLTTRYAYRSLSPDTPTSRPAIGPAPIDPDVLERIQLQNGTFEEDVLPPEPEPVVSAAPPPPRPTTSDRERIFSAPLSVHRPSRRADVERSPRTESLASALGIDPRVWASLAGQGALGPAATPLSLGVLGPHAPGAAPGVAPSPAPSSPAATPSSSIHAVLAPAHRYDVAAGTVIPAVLLHRHVSDGQGLVRAQISQDVFDTQTASHLLIPRGTIALGEPVGEPSTSSPRVAVAWTRLRFPDGRTLALPGEPAAASDGSTGLPGHVDRHFGHQLGAAVLLSLVGAGVQLSQPQRSAAGLFAPSESQLIAGQLGLELGRLSEKTLGRLLDLPPTVTLEPGTTVFLLLARDLVFDGPSVS